MKKMISGLLCLALILQPGYLVQAEDAHLSDVSADVLGDAAGGADLQTVWAGEKNLIEEE